MILSEKVGSFVDLAVRNPNPKVSQSYELYRRIYSTSKYFDYWLTQFPLSHLEAIHWLTQYTANHSGRGEKVVRVRARLKNKKIVVRKHFAF